MTSATIKFDATFAGIAAAANILRAGGLVASPSETVYGLCARADQEKAVQKIFAAKNRPRINPLISHVDSMEMARKYVQFSELAENLATAFWPGPLTMVLPRKTMLAPSVSAGLNTAAIRMPNHEIMRKLITQSAVPLAAPSANRSGRLSPTKAAHVLRDLDGKIDGIIDAGACEFGLESTVILVEDDLTLLRFGAISAEDIEAVSGKKLRFSTDITKNSSPLSPGQLFRHYAPKSRLVLNSLQGQIRLGFGTGGTLDLSPSQDLAEAAKNLFAMLDELDQIDGAEIHIAPIPDLGVGRAINDRLQRAARGSRNKSP